MVSKPTTRSFAFVLSRIDWISSHMGLSKNVREVAVDIYRQAATKRLFRSTERVVVAALYIACRKCNVPYTLNEISAVSQVSRKSVARTYKLITRELHIRLPQINPIDLVPRFASKLKLSNETQLEAINLLKRAKGPILAQDPASVASAAIYLAGVMNYSKGERRMQSDVAMVAHITEATLRKSYKNLCKEVGLDAHSTIYHLPSPLSK